MVDESDRHAARLSLSTGRTFAGRCNADHGRHAGAAHCPRTAAEAIEQPAFGQRKAHCFVAGREREQTLEALLARLQQQIATARPAVLSKEDTISAYPS